MATELETAARRTVPDWTILARRIQQGDSHAEAEMAQYFFDRVRVVAEARMRGQDAAMDVAQETILAVLESLRAGKVREPEKLPAFVLGTARNLINNHFRREAAGPERLNSSFGGLTVAEISAVGFEKRALVHAALSELNELDRRILLLTLIDGMNPREIAPMVGLKPEAVRTRKSRATKIIMEKIKKMTRKR